jgi:serine O-acetyltransferase
VTARPARRVVSGLPDDEHGGRGVTEGIWRRSCRAHRAGRDWEARWWKAVNLLLFHCVLPYEVELGEDVRLYHHGLGIVVHPNTRLGNRVTLAHGVTVAVAGDGTGSVVIDDDAHIGAHAVLLSTGGRCLTIGAGASVGANALVIDDVPPLARVLAPPAVVTTAES